jgi:hypothetical protein
VFAGAGTASVTVNVTVSPPVTGFGSAVSETICTSTAGVITSVVLTSEVPSRAVNVACPGGRLGSIPSCVVAIVSPGLIGIVATGWSFRRSLDFLTGRSAARQRDGDLDGATD